VGDNVSGLWLGDTVGSDVVGLEVTGLKLGGLDGLEEDGGVTATVGCAVGEGVTAGVGGGASSALSGQN